MKEKEIHFFFLRTILRKKNIANIKKDEEKFNKEKKQQQQKPSDLENRTTKYNIFTLIYSLML
jgi:hypothetical protein